MAESPVTPTPDNPPMKRLRLTLTMDAHSTDDLYNQLRTLANDLDYERARTGRDERDIVDGGGWFYKVEVRDSEMTPERFKDELLAWHDRQRDARRAAEGAS